MKSVFVVLSLIVAVACAHKLTPCGRYGNRSYVLDYPYAWQKFYGPRENPSSVYPDSSRCSKDSKFPLCIVSNKNSETYDPSDPTTYEYACAQCRSTCDCPTGYYCSTSDSESDDFGKCLSYKHKIGSFCNIDLGSPTTLKIYTNSSGDDAYFNQYYNVAVQPENYCAIFKRHRFPGEDQDRFAIEWLGACIFNRCYACNSFYRNRREGGPNNKAYSYDMPSYSSGYFAGAGCYLSGVFDASNEDETYYSEIKQPTRYCYRNKIVAGKTRL